MDLGESFHMSIYYLLANFGFDTAENEPCKVCPLPAYRSPRYVTLDKITKEELDAVNWVQKKKYK